MMMRKFTCLLLSLLLLGSFSGTSVLASIPWMMNYQGRLTDTDGTAITGSYTLTFRFYNASTSGNKLWQEEQTVTLNNSDNGVFNVILGSVTALTSVDFNAPIWLSLQVSNDTEMSPRQRVTATGYALNADQVDGLDSTKFVRTDIDSSSSGKLTLTKAGAAFVITPSSAPTANTKMIDVQNTSGTSKFSVDAEGDVTVAGDLTVSGAISGSSSTTGTTNTTWTVDNDNTSGTEPASGAGLVIEGGSGDASMLWDATNDTLDINKAVSITGALDATSLTLGTALGATQGGTGLSTYTTGDILYASAANTLSKLAVGSNGQVLKLSSGLPSWGTDSTASTLGFDAITTGTNTSATMTVGTGGSLTFTGSGTVNANRFNGNSTVAVADGGTGAASLSDLITLATHTTGNFVATASGTSPISISGSGSENAALTISCPTCLTTSGSANLFTAAGTSGSSQTISQGDTLTIAAGTGITTSGGATDTITVTSTLGTSIDGTEVDANTLDFTDFENTLDLDANLTLNQGSYTQSQSHTGTTTTGLTYTAASLTTGKALDVNATNTATTDAAIEQVSIDLTNAQATTANSDFAGFAVNFTNNPTIAGNTEVAMRVQHPVTTNTTDNLVSALLLLENLDTAASGSTRITDALRIQAATDTFITDGLDVSDAEIDNALNIGANAIAGTNFAVSTAGQISTGASAGNQVGSLLFYDTDATGPETITVNAPNVSTSYTLTLPTAVAASNNQVLTSQTDGTLSWATVDTSGSDDAPIDAEYIVSATNPTLTAEDVFTDGLAIDSTNAAGTFTVAFDPTELLGSRTWGDASTDTIVWTWDRNTGTDVTMTIASGAANFSGLQEAGSGVLSVADQNAGTDITADLEEETHATEHSLGGTDAITATNLASACTDAQVLGGTSGGTGVECQSDDDTAETDAKVANDITIATTVTNSASGSANPIDVTSALAAFNGSDNFTALDVNLTNANHTGASNTVYGLNIATISADAEASEYALNIGSGWDRALSITGTDIFTLGASDYAQIDGSTTANTTTAGILDLNGTSSTNNYRTLDVNTTATATTPIATAGIYNTLSSSAVVTGTLDSAGYGTYTTATKTGADTNSGTYDLYGSYATVSNTGSTNAGSKRTYGGYFAATGDTAGTATTYGVYATVSGADTNYAGIFEGGNVGIGDTTPDALLDIEGGDMRLGTGTFNNAGASEDLYITGNLEVDGTIYGTFSGNAATATALAANGANCSAGNYPLGVDASGASESCTADDDTAETDAKVADDITLAASAKSHSMTFGATNTLTLDAAATDTTTTGGVVDIDVDSLTDAAQGINLNFETTGSTASATNYAQRIALVQSAATNARTLYGMDITATDGGTLANTLVGLKVDATTANANDTVSAAQLLGGKVEIGSGTNTNATAAGELYVQGDLEIDGTIYGTFSGNAATATALAANGANCSAGNYPLGVDASGASESCTADDDTAETDAKVADNITIASSAVDQSMTFGAGNELTLDAATTDSTGTAGVIDLNLDTTTSQAGLDIDAETITDAAVDTVSAIKVTATQTSTDDDVLYGINIANLAGTADAGNEYAIYQAGTAWDYGLYAEDSIFVGGNLVVGNGTPGVTQDGEDAYVEGTLEVDGNTTLGDYLAVGGAVNAAQPFRVVTTLDSSDTCVVGCIGVVSAPTINNPANPTLAIGVHSQVTTADAAFTLTTSEGMRVTSPVKGASSTITNNYGINVLAQTAGTSDYGVAIGAADTQTLWVSSNADNSTAAAGMAFGSSRDTNLYRSAADTLKTDDALVVTGALTATLTGNASTATALAGDGANCSAGNYPLGVDASGAVQSCTADDDTAETDAKVADNITIASSAVDQSMTFGASNELTLDAAATDSTGTAGVIDLNLDTTSSQAGLDIDAETITDSAVDTVSAIKITGTQTSTDDDVLYGINIANLAGTADAGNEYALSIGTGWDRALSTTGTNVFTLGAADYVQLDATTAVTAASREILQLDFANFVNTSGTKTQTALDIDLSNANHTGGTMNLYGIDLQLTDNDAASTSDVYAINVGTGFDRAFSAAGTGVFTLGASDTLTLDAAATDSTGTAGVIDLDLDTTSSQAGLDIDAETITDAAVDTVSAIKVTATQTSTDNDILYGLNIAALAGTADSGNEYAVVIGSGWDRSISASGTIVTSGKFSIPTTGDVVGSDGGMFIDYEGSTAADVMVRVDSDTIANDTTILDITSDGNFLLKTGDNETAQTITINATSANVTTADTFIDFRSTSGSIGSIAGTATSGLIAYNTFTGSHYTRIADREGLEPNILLEATGERIPGEQGHLVASRISSTRQSQAAYGVYGGTDKEGRDLVLSIGTGYIWVTNKGENVEVGDYLMSSDVRGHAERQDDDIYHNHTVAKAMEPIQWKAEEAKRLIACIYLGG